MQQNRRILENQAQVRDFPTRLVCPTKSANTSRHTPMAWEDRFEILDCSNRDYIWMDQHWSQVNAGKVHSATNLPISTVMTFRLPANIPDANARSTFHVHALGA